MLLVSSIRTILTREPTTKAALFAAIAEWAACGFVLGYFLTELCVFAPGNLAWNVGVFAAAVSAGTVGVIRISVLRDNANLVGLLPFVILVSVVAFVVSLSH